MARVGFVLKVRGERLEEYRRIHRDVWPEMLAALRRHRWRNYTLFLRDDGMLFGTFETPESLEAAKTAIAREEVYPKWQAMMAPFFEPPDPRRPGKIMIELEEVFHTD